MDPTNPTATLAGNAGPLAQIELIDKLLELTSEQLEETFNVIE